MKTSVVLVLILIGLGVGYLIALQFQPKPDNSALIAKHDAEKKKYEAEGRRYLDEIINLQAEIDSLKVIPRTILTQVVYKQAEIDSAILKDSANAVQEYRKGLLTLQIRPDGTKYPTLREIGYGGLLFAELYGMRLTVPNLNETINKQGQLIDKQGSLLGIKDNIISIDSSLIVRQDLLLKEKDSFWRNRFVFYIGIGGNWNGLTLAPGIQAGVGIRIVGNE